MTVSRTDVQAFSSGPAPEAPSISIDEADRIASVLNRNSIHRPGLPPPGVPGEPGVTTVSVNEPGRSADLGPETNLAEPGRREADPRVATRRPRPEVLRLMQRTGYSSTQIDEVRALLPEQVDSEQDRSVLEKYGLTRAMLMECFGSSP